MAFNPDKYLAEKNAVPQDGGFDPDRYLSEKSGQSNASTAGAALVGAARGVPIVGSYLPEIGGAIEKLSSISQSPQGATGPIKQSPQFYAQPTLAEAAAPYRQAEQQIIQESPKAALAGELAGGVLAGGAAGKALGLGGKVLSLPKQVAIGAGAAGTIAALESPKKSGEEKDYLDIEGRLQRGAAGAAVGGAVAGTVGVLAKAGGALSQYVAEKAKSKAESSAVKALGGGKRVTQQLQKSGQDAAIGRTLLDENAIPVLGTPSRIAGRVEGLKEKTGEQIRSLVKLSGDKKVIDGAELGVNLLEDPDILQYKRTPGLEKVAKIYDQFADTLASRGQMNLEEAQTLRQQIDKSINFAKGSEDMRGKQEALYKVRTIIRDKMNEVVDSLKGGTNELKNVNLKYSNLAKASDILGDKIARDASNRSISLTDTIAAAGGLSTGGPGIAVAAGAVNKLMRTFGDSITARAADSVARKAKYLPQVADAIQKNPAIIPVLIQNEIQEVKKSTNEGSSAIKRRLNQGR